ncbi:MAG: serine hydrolase [Ruminococcus flavefaciens]|nr:serine hydrolase [Ruminococcus flavefaciens]MCM1229692.1 serine hydrolase [Ruminococcus flavefaciens]
MKKICIILSAVITFLLAVPQYSSADSFDEIKSYILIESVTGTVIEEKNSSQRLNAGYLSKLMTLLLVAEDIETGKYQLSTELTASQSVSGTKGAVVWLEPGDRMTVEELVKSVIIGNANDAVTVLAEKSEQTVEKFVMRMNSEAFDLGLRDTAFYSPYGYYDEREYTTASDLAVICSRLARYEFMRPYFSTWRDFVKSGQTELVNENTLARTYDRHIGFKACHSEESGYCIAEAGINDGKTCYIAVILGAESDDVSLGCAKKLINKGFSDYKVTATMFPDEMLMPIRVKNGEDTAVEIHLRNQSSLVVPRGVDELSTVVVIPEYLSAPVRKGQKIGTAGFYSEKNLVCEIDIITSDSVNELTFGFILKKTLCNLLK